jgi:hypothetical protein
MNAIKTKKKNVKSTKLLGVSDPCWSLTKWKQFIDNLLEDYPANSVLSTDAGYNNVSLVLEYSHRNP